MNTVINSTTTYNTAITQLNVQLNQFQGAANQAAGGVGGLNGQLRTLTAIAAVQSVASLARQFESATREAADFSRSIGLIQTISADAGLSYQQWAEGIRQVSDSLGTPILETSAATYDLLSNQIAKGADAFQTLTVAGNLANVTGSRVTDSINALSSAINAFGYSAGDAETLAAKMFATVDLGRVRLSEIANTSGRVYEEAKALGVSFEEVNASLISITQTGIKANTAMTLTNALFNGLLKPTDALKSLFDEMGVASADAAIKTFGFSNVLDRIRDKTNGSAAAVAKYFNELKSRQAFDILIDRSDAFRQALTEQDKALERSREALERFQSTPGFKFQKEANAFANELTTGIKADLLNSAAQLSDSVGGVRHAFNTALPLIGAAGAGLATFAVSAGAASIAATGFGAALGTIAWPVTIAAVTAELAHQLLLWQQDRVAAERLYDSLSAHQAELARAGAAEDAKRRAEDVADAKKTLDAKQRDILAFAAEARRTLSKISDGLQDSGATLSAKLRNDVDLVLTGSKDVVKAIESQLSKALSNVAAARSARGEIASSRGDSLYNARLAMDQAETGGANERDIMQQRLDDLSREMALAKQRGNLEAYNRASGQSEAIINQAATSGKYYGAERAITEFYSQRARDALTIEAVNQRITDKLAQQKLTLEGQLKAAEDAGKALYDLKVTDRQGDPVFGSKAELESKAGGLFEQFNNAVAALNANPAAGNELRGANLIQAQSLLSQRLDQLRTDYASLTGNLSKQQGALDSGGRLETAIGGLSKVMTDAAEKIAASVAVANSLGATALEAHGSLHAALGTIRGESGLDIRTATPEFRGRRDQLVQTITQSSDHGDWDAARTALDGLTKWVQATGFMDQAVMTSGPRHAANDELIHPTPRQSLDYVRVLLSNAQEADREARASSMTAAGLTVHGPEALGSVADALKRLSDSAGTLNPERVNTAVDSFESLISRLGQSLNRIEGLAKGAGETAASKSMGGFAGYFAAGGSPRGIDTALVRMDPREFIMNPQASMRFRSQLQAMNQGWSPFGSGSGTGEPGHTFNGGINISVQGGGSSQQTADEIAHRIQRRIRQRTIRLT